MIGVVIDLAKFVIKNRENIKNGVKAVAKAAKIIKDITKIDTKTDAKVSQKKSNAEDKPKPKIPASVSASLLLTINNYNQDIKDYLLADNFIGTKNRFEYVEGKKISSEIENTLSTIRKLYSFSPPDIQNKCRDFENNIISSGFINTNGIDNDSYLSNTQNFQKLNVIESITDILKTSLLDAPPSVDLSIAKNSDTFIFGDSQSQFDLLVQNLYIAGIINKTGSLNNFENEKTGHIVPKQTQKIIQFGNSIEKRAYRIEEMIYLRALQQEMSKHSSNLVIILGQTEFELINNKPKTFEDSIARQILTDDIINDRVKLCYADNKNNYLAMPSGMNKKTLLKTLLKMSHSIQYKNKMLDVAEEIEKAYLALELKHTLYSLDTEHKSNNINTTATTERIYKDLIFKSGLTLTDISDFINSSFKDAVKYSLENHTNFDKNHPLAFLLLDENNLLNSQNKFVYPRNTERGRNNPKDYLIKESDTKYQLKPIQFTSSQIDMSAKTFGYGKPFGILQNKAVIHCSSGSRGCKERFQAFVSYDSSRKTMYAVEISGDNGLKHALNPDLTPITIERKIRYINIRNLNDPSIFNKTADKKLEI